MLNLNEMIRAAASLEKTDIELSRDLYLIVRDNSQANSKLYDRAKSGLEYTNRVIKGRLFDGSFNHKVQARISKGGNYLYSLCSDKYRVRDYVGSRLGAEVLIPLLGVVSGDNEFLNFKDVKNCFIKPNNAAGRYLSVSDGGLKSAEVNYFNQTINKWLKTPFGSKRLESHYLDIEPKVLIEKSIKNGEELPVDYKFHMFKQKDGQFKYVLQVVKERGSELGTSHCFFDNQLDTEFFDSYQLTRIEVKKLPECIEMSKTLMDNFDYARVDWYLVGEKIYFGELTFTPGAGRTRSIPIELQHKMSEYWQLSPKY